MVDDSEYVLLDVAIVARWRGLSQLQELIQKTGDDSTMQVNRSVCTARSAALAPHFGYVWYREAVLFWCLTLHKINAGRRRQQ